MKRRSLTIISLLLLAFLQVVLGPRVGRFFPELLIVFLLFLLFVLPQVSVFWLAFFAGLAAEIFSSLPFGIFVLPLLAVVFLSNFILQRVLAQRSLPALLVLVVFGVVGFFAIEYGLLTLVNEAPGYFVERFLLAVVPTVLSSVVLAGIMGLMYPTAFEIKVK